MITYLQEQHKGTVGKHVDNFELYLDTEVFFDEELLKWFVYGKVRLKVINKTCIGNPTFILTVNSQDKSTDVWMKDKVFESGEYVLGSFLSIYSASFADTTVNIYAKLLLEANEEGPGECSIEHTITLPFALNASGIMLLNNIGGSSINLKVVNMAPTLGYDRYIDFYYKKSIDEEYIFIDREILTSDATSYSRSILGLLAGVSYDFRCVITSSSGEHLITLDRTIVTSLVMPRLDILYRTTSEIMLKISELESVVNYDRVLVLNYIIKGSVEWVKYDAIILSIPAGTTASEYIFEITGLEAGTNYEFQIVCNNEELIIFTKSIFASTLSEIEEEDVHTIIVAEGTLYFSIKNSELNVGEKKLVAYIQDPKSMKYYFVCDATSSFFKTGYEFVITPDVSADIKSLLSAEAPTFKLIFLDPTTSIVENIRYVVGG